MAITDSTGYPIESLPITLVSFPGHQDPGTGDIYLQTSIKDHDDETLVERRGDIGKGTINKHLDLDRK